MGESNGCYWTVEEVVEYFGEFLETKEKALEAMAYCTEHEQGLYKLSYKQRMNVMRNYLITLGFDVVF